MNMDQKKLIIVSTAIVLSGLIGCGGQGEGLFGQDTTAIVNIASLILGLAALIIPVVMIIRKMSRSTFVGGVFLSFICCMLAVLLQLYEMHHLVQIQDWSALLDTSAVVVSASGQLILGTVVLNVVAFFRRRQE